MVYARNGGFTLDGDRVHGEVHVSRAPGRGPRLRRLVPRARLPTCTRREQINEGEGDFLLVGDAILAGTGFRTSIESHAELARGDRPRGRHPAARRHRGSTTWTPRSPCSIPTGADANIAYLPEAFDEASRAELQRRYPDAIEVGTEDARWLGPQLDLRRPQRRHRLPKAKGFEASLRERGYTPIGLDLAELLLGGGGVKCCTLELRSAR